ncbi:uncharacterized protein LOC112876756 isoform X1 [Panicum hallii]|uniref:uncharacterized protein LOC112876756 isoform X1 n=1 Tax=Panicum hallii TaxID=206008 RepID=UPI000DF4DAC1|nr:uncharacterized protein LOC112876756 isoform X1 [Panicum hallii]XP_025796715.1 uncharacterized protein LOC112876756 isoform X1 [Panicum hallii]XP_025796716.1 uncharacterized protein LOC112876756 isoform X1 [Panicum hallii]XP_025796717.1 uncharacterized protein LOC112876756 isoform X1 [Panicum hallii]XP_025796718.1 uncharacterized protein LOC112876756 isoform X1 [Panicum hallii]XP_025796719.1 uncharacterized protein LOC112876756 isoform X1 [Panicum hallii]
MFCIIPRVWYVSWPVAAAAAAALPAGIALLRRPHKRCAPFLFGSLSLDPRRSLRRQPLLELPRRLGMPLPGRRCPLYLLLRCGDPRGRGGRTATTTAAVVAHKRRRVFLPSLAHVKTSQSFAFRPILAWPGDGQVQLRPEFVSMSESARGEGWRREAAQIWSGTRTRPWSAGAPLLRGAWMFPGRNLMLAKRRQDIERENFYTYIEEMMEQDEEEATKTMPPTRIVKYYDLLGKAWGWDRLLPLAGVSRSDYSKYIEEYFRRNARELVPGAAAALAEICLKKEEQLASQWKIRMEPKMEQILPSRSIILSCLIHERIKCTFSHSHSGLQIF